MDSKSRWASINLQYVNNMESGQNIYNSDTTKKVNFGATLELFSKLF